MDTVHREWKPTVAGRRLELATVLRVLGRTLLTMGVLLLGFVVYELFVTSFFAGRAQAGLTEQFEQRVATVQTETVAYEPAGLGLLVVPIDVPDDLPAPDPEAVAALESAYQIAPVGAADDPGAAADPAPAAAEPAPAGSIVVEPPTPAGDAIGRIAIPSIGLEWTVVEGVGKADLRKGAGHMPDTAVPGQPGNAVISGHRTTYGAPFHDLGRTRKGDLIAVTTATGAHVYQIVEKRIVQPNETWVTGQWQGSWLTLTTCHPKFSSRERLVVIARLVGGPNASSIEGGL